MPAFGVAATFISFYVIICFERTDCDINEDVPDMEEAEHRGQGVRGLRGPARDVPGCGQGIRRCGRVPLEERVSCAGVQGDVLREGPR